MQAFIYFIVGSGHRMNLLKVLAENFVSVYGFFFQTINKGTIVALNASYIMSWFLDSNLLNSFMTEVLIT